MAKMICIETISWLEEMKTGHCRVCTCRAGPTDNTVSSDTAIQASSASPCRPPRAAIAEVLPSFVHCSLVWHESREVPVIGDAR